MTKPLISVDVGGTIGFVDAPSIAQVLVASSPLHEAKAREVLRAKLYTQDEMNSAFISELCSALCIPESAFPQFGEPEPLQLIPGALSALRTISGKATVATLSNVSCLEMDSKQLAEMLHPWVSAFFPSCQIGYAKPDPAAFQHVAKVFGTTTSRMIHIGNDWNCDVIGARLAGARAIWISNGKPIPEPDRLGDGGVSIAADLVSASRLVEDLTKRSEL